MVQVWNNEMYSKEPYNDLCLFVWKLCILDINAVVNNWGISYNTCELSSFSAWRFGCDLKYLYLKQILVFTVLHISHGIDVNQMHTGAYWWYVSTVCGNGLMPSAPDDLNTLLSNDSISSPGEFRVQQRWVITIISHTSEHGVSQLYYRHFW